ncbi:MAG: lamin tail domain-containing protein [Myxococcota bacterium]
MLGGLLTLVLAAQGAVVINEFEADPAGADGGYEWIELYNDGAAPVDVSGWTIQKATNTYSTVFTFDPGVSIPAGGYVVIGEASVVGVDYYAPSVLGMGNASSSGDAIRLVDGGGTPVDTVVYGPDNADAFLDDTGAIATNIAPRPVSGVSLARQPNGSDTNASGNDFVVAAFSTLGESNDAALPSCDPVGAAPGLVINELVPDPAGTDTDMEWVELYLPGGGPVDLSGWVVASGTSAYTALATLPPGTTISGGQFLVISQSGLIPVWDVVAPGFSLGNASNADAVQLRDCFGNTVDTVVYGLDNTMDNWLDDTGAPALLAPKPGSGEALLRIPDGADTNNSSADFQVGFPTPGGSNTAPPPDCGAIGSGLVINELMSNPEGADDGAEWIELYHAGVAPIDLSGWAVQSATSDSWSARFTFEAGTTINPGGFLLLGGPLVPGSTYGMSGSLGNGTGGDGVRIVDCSGFPADVVVYGGVNDDAVTDESGAPAISIAPTPPEGLSIQRVEDGYDTNQSGLDFAVADTITPGQPNIPLAPIVCEPDPGTLRINEILPDPDGTDDGLEFIEIYNSGTAPARLDGWSISAGTSDYDDLDITFPGGILVQPGQFFVVGGDLVPEATYVTTFSLGNGTSSRDGVRLYDCTGASVDTVVYGVANELEPDVGIVDDNDQLAPSYGDPPSQQTLQRVMDGVDSDTPEDWMVARPTPGSTNEVEFGPGTDTEPLGCGCGGGGAPNGKAPNSNAPGSDAPTGTGCSVVPGQLSAVFWALAVVAFRRRSQVRIAVASAGSTRSTSSSSARATSRS